MIKLPDEGRDMAVVEGEVGTRVPEETQGYISNTTVTTGVLNESNTREVTCGDKYEYDLLTQVTNDTHSYQ